ncbi:MAG: isoaspartyl peptidase/L-asparaginase, partial [Ignavibacteriaceae bacterium]|nr:isoaspartyl peptidase/L-asparaginase [Ignavibacteriaceae bacterium]
MKRFKIFFLLLIFSLCFNLTCFAQLKNEGIYTIVVHGGAGTIDKSMPDSIKQAYLNSLSEALRIGEDILEKGGTSLDAVENVLKYFETEPKFNAGIGSVYTADG